ncbi:MAG: hypothetical protein Q8N03_14465 [Ignavibacteria bacterium]|nr:hypothetical protein [Ignavibacteria bacterium]
MKTGYIKILIITLMSNLLLLAQTSAFKTESLTGNLKFDSKQLLSLNKSEKMPGIIVSTDKKNPMIAGLLSLVLPGAGEFYTGEYLKAAIFLGLEVAIVTTALTYDKKGDDQTEVFEGFADQNWSVVKYAEWLIRHESASIPINPNQSLPPWERVNWDSLNAYEKKFSHKLPKHGDQQYYELIGKYPQYSPGWNAFDPNEPDYHVLPSIFLEYSKMRGEANDHYAVASTAVKIMYINHFLSLIDAVWSAISFNNDLAISVKVDRNYYAFKEEYYPTLYVKYNF